MLAEGLIVANPMRDLVGSVGRAEFGRGAAARGGGAPNGAPKIPPPNKSAGNPAGNPLEIPPRGFLNGFQKIPTGIENP